ncbi:protein phosphatase 2C domain-containing protein [Streptomyces sp. NPDC008222]|uniref:protein phosphatase 2C domain-containing protein n=1 Tax=Streptomyces sp. NPDC008222 TaxID=3364820 RepID=UPI0036EEA893
MSQQGEKPDGHEDDWWGQLYDDSTEDTGPAPGADSLDDRFASAAGTVDGGTPPFEGSSEGESGAAVGADDGGGGGARGSGPVPRQGPVPWEPPSTRPPGPVTFPPGPMPPGFREVAPFDGSPTGPSSAQVPPPDHPPAAVPPPPARPPAAVPPPPDRSPALPTGAAPAGSAPAVVPPPGEAPPPAARPPAEAVVPRTPAPVDYVGSGPPTYDAEPTALPLADPDGLDDLVPDTVLDGARYGALTLRAASVRGDSARFRGEPRRDCLLTARFGTGDQALVLVAMATGARATPGAHRAAAQVCRWIGRAVGRSHVRLAEDIRAARRGDLKSGLHRLTDRSLGRLRASAAEQGVDPEEYTAGLRCLLLPADPACRTRVFFGVGEGGLFRLRGGEWQDIEPRVAESAGEPVVGFGSLPSETPEGDRLTMDLGITTSPHPDEPSPGLPVPPEGNGPVGPPRDPFRFRASVARPGDTLVLCSSGLADPLRDEPQLARHLTLRWSTGGPPSLDAFLVDTRVRVKGYADDRTAAAVWEA